MNTNDLNTALYEKMSDEQDKFRDWLKSQPPEEILHHTYEYTVREDIVMAMEQLELTDAQAQALLDSSSPLDDVYHYFEKLETGYMDVIRDSIENRADDVCRVLLQLPMFSRIGSRMWIDRCCSQFLFGSAHIVGTALNAVPDHIHVTGLQLFKIAVHIRQRQRRFQKCLSLGVGQLQFLHCHHDVLPDRVLIGMV